MRILSVQEVANRLGLTDRQVRRRCAEGKLAARREGGQWRIPADADGRLWAAYGPAHVRTSSLPDVGEEKRNEALRRAGLVNALEDHLVDVERGGGGVVGAVAAFAAQHGIATATLWRWRKGYRRNGLSSLCDRRGGNQRGDIGISPEAWRVFTGLYLDERRPSIRLCWRMVVQVNEEGKKGWSIPPLWTMQRLVRRRIPQPVLVLHREGQQAYNAKCSPYLERDPDSLEAGEVWVGDHHQLNLWVRYRGRWVRPWITAWEDLGSRMIVGWHVSAGPNQDTILLACRRAVKVYGPPQAVKVDNGRDYASQMWTGAKKKTRRILKGGYLDEAALAGIYAELDIRVSFAIPYSPQSKAVERWFATLDEQFCKVFATYCGKDPQRRPEGLGSLLADPKVVAEALSLEEFAAKVGVYIKDVYNQSPHQGTGMEGRSPAEVIASRTTKRVLADPAALDLILRGWTRAIKVGKNGVRISGIWYGQFSRELMEWQGKEVRCSYDPDDMGLLNVHNAATRKLIAVVDANRQFGYRPGVRNEDLREGMREKRRAQRTVKEYRDASARQYMDAADLAVRAQRQREALPAPAAVAQQVKVVWTAFDGEKRQRDQIVAAQAGRKAAGAEGRKPLNFDFSLMPRAQERVRQEEARMGAVQRFGGLLG